jgi:hypothetical protein
MFSFRSFAEAAEAAVMEGRFAVVCVVGTVVACFAIACVVGSFVPSFAVGGFVAAMKMGSSSLSLDRSMTSGLKEEGIRGFTMVKVGNSDLNFDLPIVPATRSCWGQTESR